MNCVSSGCRCLLLLALFSVTNKTLAYNANGPNGSPAVNLEHREIDESGFEEIKKQLIEIQYGINILTEAKNTSLKGKICLCVEKFVSPFCSGNFRNSGELMYLQNGENTLRLCICYRILTETRYLFAQQPRRTAMSCTNLVMKSAVFIQLTLMALVPLMCSAIKPQPVEDGQYFRRDWAALLSLTEAGQTTNVASVTWMASSGWD